MNHSKTSTTYFVVNLAISDIIVCLTFFPLWLVKYVSTLANIESTMKLICEIGITSSFTSVALSIANLLTITGDRYMLITKPLKYPMIVTSKRIRIFLLVIWTIAIVNANLVFFNIRNTRSAKLLSFKRPSTIWISSCQHFFANCRTILFQLQNLPNSKKSERKDKERESYKSI